MLVDFGSVGLFWTIIPKNALSVLILDDLVTPDQVLLGTFQLLVFAQSIDPLFLLSTTLLMVVHVVVIVHVEVIRSLLL